MDTPADHRPVEDIVEDIETWLIERSLEGDTQEQLLEGYCTRLAAAGIALQRLHVAQRAIHPVFGGIGFDWHHATGVSREEYAHSAAPTDAWVRSPHYRMMAEGLHRLHLRADDEQAQHQYPILTDLSDAGATDYFAIVMPFAKKWLGRGVDPNNPPEGVALSWTTAKPGGFDANDIAVIDGLMPSLGLALKAASNSQMARDLLATYLGADAGSRVLSGEIQRGSLESVRAVIWDFDLRGFTRLAGQHSGPEVIAMLNDYFGAVVPVVERHGGNVLKFMGDGLLAIFGFGEGNEAGRNALEAAIEVRRRIAEITRRRGADGLPCTGFALAMHAGDVLYGNIGAESRLDFTVIGSAVNTTARILGMCRQLEQEVIVSSRVAALAMADRDDLVSVGRYLLRGVPEPQELFALHSADAAKPE